MNHYILIIMAIPTISLGVILIHEMFFIKSIDIKVIEQMKKLTDQVKAWSHQLENHEQVIHDKIVRTAILKGWISPDIGKQKFKIKGGSHE